MNRIIIVAALFLLTNFTYADDYEDINKLIGFPIFNDKQELVVETKLKEEVYHERGNTIWKLLPVQKDDFNQKSPMCIEADKFGVDFIEFDGKVEYYSIGWGLIKNLKNKHKYFNNIEKALSKILGKSKQINFRPECRSTTWRKGNYYFTLMSTTVKGNLKIAEKTKDSGYLVFMVYHKKHGIYFTPQLSPKNEIIKNDFGDVYIQSESIKRKTKVFYITGTCGYRDIIKSADILGAYWTNIETKCGIGLRLEGGSRFAPCHEYLNFILKKSGSKYKYSRNLKFTQNTLFETVINHVNNNIAVGVSTKMFRHPDFKASRIPRFKMREKYVKDNQYKNYMQYLQEIFKPILIKAKQGETVGHITTAIGYNKKTDEILTTDGWMTVEELYSQACVVYYIKDLK